MSKKRTPPQKQRTGSRKPRLIILLFASLAIATAVSWSFASRQRVAKNITKQTAPTTNSLVTKSLPTVEVAQALMVTEELDFGGNPPSIAEALQFIERRHEPEDGRGRTFAILDAYGEPTPNKKLHISMHLSMEKPGVGSLIFRPTGKVLWKSKIVLAPGGKVTPLDQRSLLILVDNAQGKLWTIDGSNNPATILDANVKELNLPLRDVWPDGTEREFTYIYSACGCPVKALVRRLGNSTMRAKDLPVLFPDDPAALQVISNLMGWASRGGM